MLVLAGGETIGSYRLFPGRIRIAGRDYRFTWGSTWEFDAGRGSPALAGLLLMRALREASGSLGACGVSTSALPVYRAARFETVHLQRMVRVLRSKAILRRRVGARIADPVSRVVDAVVRLADRLNVQSVAARDLVVEPLMRFDAATDSIDRAMLREHAFPREHEELNWIIDHPWSRDNHRYLIFALRQRSDRTLVGWSLGRLRDIDGTGTLLRTALLPDSGDAATALVRGAVAIFAQYGAERVELCSNDPLLLRAAVRCGMLRRGFMTLQVRLGGVLARAAAAHDARLERFHTQMGEGDVAFL